MKCSYHRERNLFKSVPKNEAKKERKNHQPGHFPSAFPITPSNPSRDGGTRTFETNEAAATPLAVIERGYRVKVEGRERKRAHTNLALPSLKEILRGGSWLPYDFEAKEVELSSHFA